MSKRPRASEEFPVKANCEICRGSGLIRVPIFKRSVGPRDVPAFGDRDETSRSYPCPECSGSIPQERLEVVQYHGMVDMRDYDGDPEFKRYVARNAAHNFVDALLQEGFIRYESGPGDSSLGMRVPIRATLGVVSPRHVATLEQRIAVRQEELAREVIIEAERQIVMRPPPYTGAEGFIWKLGAVEAVKNALHVVLEKSAAMRPGLPKTRRER
jgi:hypothetical protein